MKEGRFQCDGCACCCLSVNRSLIYQHLDRGDGACKYLDDMIHKCKIYDIRPLMCNVDAYYDKYLSEKISRQEFHKLNYASCKKLKQDFLAKQGVYQKP